MKYALIAAVIIIAGIAWYGISPLFNTKHVDDALPPGMMTETDETSQATTTNGSPASTESNTTETDTQSMPMFGTEPMSVIGTTGHPASGTARIIYTDTGPVVRYENFSTINGPNLHVYLATNTDADDFIDLGPIKGTEGNINYAIPDGVDLETYNVVMTWCVPFGVLFNYVELQ